MKKHFVSLKLNYQSGFRTRNLRQAALTTASGPLVLEDGNRALRGKIGLLGHFSEVVFMDSRPTYSTNNLNMSLSTMRSCDICGSITNPVRRYFGQIILTALAGVYCRTMQTLW